MYCSCKKEEGQEEPTTCWEKIFNLIKHILILLLAFTTVLFSYLYYHALVAIVLFTYHSFINEWLSLVLKSNIEIVLFTVTYFSDFGLFFTTSLICVYVVSDFLTFIVWIFRILNKIDTINFTEKKDPEDAKTVYKTVFFAYVISIAFITLFFLFINQYIIFIISIICEILFLCIVFAYKPIMYIKNKICKKEKVENTIDLNEKSDKSDCSFSSSSSSVSPNDSLKTYFEKFKSKFFENSLVYVGSLEGMFDTKFKGRVICCGRTKGYKIAMCTYVTISQLFLIIYPFAKKAFPAKDFIMYVVVKIVFIYKLYAYNFFDFINIERAFHSLKHFKAKVTYAIVILAFIISFIFFSVFLNISSVVNSPVKSARYIETNQTWYKFKDGKTITPQGFCFAQHPIDETLKIEDLAMLTTLPRLYNISKDGKCYIIPSKRGLFNSTMKYIFGRNYEEDGINILCRIMSHYPFLILTSDKIYNQTLSHYQNNENFTFLDKQFNVKNKDYFQDLQFENLTEESNELLSRYEECVETNGTQNCEDEWDSFTQVYWSNEHSDEYENIKGFEKYQINISPDTIIQPSFITENGELMAGTHYIIGGSYEDKYGSSLLYESFVRSIMPDILENFLILFSFVRSIHHDIFLSIEWINRKIFLIDLVSLHEMSAISDIYSQFNFSHFSLFTVGHSISGTAFKGASFTNDIQGIAFESLRGDNLVNFDAGFNPKQLKNKISNSFNQIINIYSSSNTFSGSDDNCDVNGILPQRYSMPNVFDTACLTAITCSQTMKYVPLCKQVLYSQYGKTSEEEFNESFNAFLDYYRFN